MPLVDWRALLLGFLVGFLCSLRLWLWLVWFFDLAMLNCFYFVLHKARHLFYTSRCYNVDVYTHSRKFLDLITNFKVKLLCFRYGSFHLSLFVIIVLFIFLVVNLEVSEFVRIASRSHYAEPISQVVLFQVFLCQILQVPLGKWDGWV